MLDVSYDYCVIENQINEKPSDSMDVNQHDQECSLLHLSSSLINYKEPSKNNLIDIDSIPHSNLDQDELVFFLDSIPLSEF